MRTDKWRVYLGPIGIHAKADMLRENGWKVCCIDTEHIHVERPNDGWGCVGIAHDMEKTLGVAVDTNNVMWFMGGH